MPLLFWIIVHTNEVIIAKRKRRWTDNIWKIFIRYFIPIRISLVPFSTFSGKNSKLIFHIKSCIHNVIIAAGPFSTFVPVSRPPELWHVLHYSCDHYPMTWSIIYHHISITVYFIGFVISLVRDMIRLLFQ